MPVEQTKTAPAIELDETTEGATWIRLRGMWDLQQLSRRLNTLERRLKAHAAPDVGWDLTGVIRLDTVACFLLLRVWGNRLPAQRRMTAEQERFFQELADVGTPPYPRYRPDWLAPVIQLGRMTLALAEHLRALTVLFGQLLLDLGHALRQPHRAPWFEGSALIHKMGTRALGITALVGALIGVVVSYLSAIQLQAFGADDFIIDIVGIAVLRELGPLLAAILVAGRSGSAITAELGVMRVTQEIDALRVLGISPTFRLVLPRVIALMVALPLLTIWTNAIAIGGGMVAAQVELGIPLHLSLITLPEVVPIANLWIGLGKAVVFGFLIGLVGCHFGLRVAPNTESLGRETTNAVVASITAVILVDAVFAVALRDVGLV